MPYLLILIVLSSCDKLFIETDPENDETTCFNIFWSNYDMNYPSFILKNIDWDSVKVAGISQIETKGLFIVLQDIGKILQDGHFEVRISNALYIWSPSAHLNRNLNSPVNIKYYITLRDIYTTKIQYGTYNQIGYISIRDFGLAREYYEMVSDIIVNQFKDKQGIIIDIRDNPGGNSSNGELITSLFAGRKILSFRYRFRNGPDHNDLVDIDHYINPSDKVYFAKPVAVLTNKRCGSATETFCLDMRLLPNVFLVGDTTYGSTTDPEFQELPNGWTYRLPVSYIVTTDNKVFEGTGIPPDYPVWISKEDSIQKKDVIFEKAVELIENRTR